jgi:phytoene synthase
MRRPGAHALFGNCFLNMTKSLAQSFGYCERLARLEAGNFYHAFRILPGSERQALCALYAFLRVTDDLTDGVESLEFKQAALDSWRSGFDRALAGEFRHPVHEALEHTLTKYKIPRDYIDAVLDGVEMDLRGTSYPTFADLYKYCYRVASAVGLSCIHIWGSTGEQAKIYAERAGIAFQLTNILRDLLEDARRGRVYLPAEDLERFGYHPDQILRQEYNQPFRDLMHFEVGRARGCYLAAEPLIALLPAPGRAVYKVMSGTYRGVLEAIERRNYDVFHERVGLSRWHKLVLVAQALPTRWLGA